MSEKTSKNWNKYTPEMRAHLDIVARNKTALLTALEEAGVDLTKLGYQRMAGAGNVVMLRAKGKREPIVFVTYKGLVEIAKQIGVKWTEVKP